MTTLVNFLMINNTQTLGNLFTYVESTIKDLSSKGLMPNAIPVNEISDNVFAVEYVYTNEFYATHWQLFFEFGTFNSSNQLQITILSSDYVLKIDDNYLEQLKLSIKNKIKSDWKEIVWLMDKDSEQLSISLYPSIYQAENLARQLINEIMTKEYGIGWWDVYVPMNIRKKHRARMGGYKSVVPGFANVDERLMSIDIGDLSSIFTLTDKKWLPAFDAEISNFLNDLSEMSLDKVKEILSRQMALEKDLWAEQFSKYLSGNFIENFRVFEMNRNHVVHNKLIDRAAHTVILSSIQKVEAELKEALRKVAEVVISAEQREIISQQMKQEQEEMRTALLEIMESEAGIRIRTTEEIAELFDDKLCEFHEEFQSHMRFRNDIVIGEYNGVIHSEDSGKLFDITYKITDSTFSVNYSNASIDSSEGADSAITVSIQIHSNSYSKQIRYTNGEASYNEYQGNFMPETQDMFNMSDLEELMNELVEFIDTHFKNMREKVDSDMYTIIKDGGNSPVADGVTCYECGEEYICIDEKYGTYGQCLNCGEKNDISVCSRCGCFFEGEPSDDGVDFCESCSDDFMKE